MNQAQVEGFLHLFIRGGYVLDFSTDSFNKFTKKSIGIPLCEKYGLSKGKSLAAYCQDASEEDVIKLFTDLLGYYEINIKDSPDEKEYIPLYEECKKTLGEKMIKVGNSLKTKVEDLIKRGEVIEKEEYHPAENGFLFSYVSGPMYDQWMSEIGILNDRYLKSHPLYKQIQSVTVHYRKRLSAHKEMMGYLRALLEDDEFFDNFERGKSIPNEQIFQPVEQKVINYIDNSITIGDGNRLSKTNIGNGNTISITDTDNQITNSEEKKSFVSRHPILISALISLIVGFLLLFSFWKDIINWIEGLF